jgi:hypothetical protein
MLARMNCMRCGGPVEDIAVPAAGEAPDTTRCARCRLHYTRIVGYAVPPHDTQVLSRSTPLHCRREPTDLACAGCGSLCEVVTYSRGLLRSMVAHCGACGLIAVDALDRDPLRAMSEGVTQSARNEATEHLEPGERRQRSSMRSTQPLIRLDAPPAPAPPTNDLVSQLKLVAHAFVLTNGPEKP